MTTINLVAPVGAVSSLSLSDPTPADARHVYCADPIEGLVNLLSQLSGQPISVIRQITVTDFAACFDAISTKLGIG